MSDLAGAILFHVNALRGTGKYDDDALEVAVQCLTQAFGQNAPAAPPSSHALDAVYAAGVTALSQSNNKFNQFLDGLKAKGMFNGVAVGSAEYDSLMAKIVSKYEAKHGVGSAGDASAASLSSSSSSASGTGAAPSAAQIAEAESLKNQGNQALGLGQTAKAIECYTKAIALHERNHVFYSNRAAAHLSVKTRDADLLARRDCERSIEIDPTYYKAHYRLGQACASLEEWPAAVTAFTRAKALNPSDARVGEQLAQAEARASAASSSRSADADGGVDAGAAGAGNPMGGLDLGALLGAAMGGAGGGGGAGGLDIGAMLGNPAMQQMMAGMMGGGAGGGDNPMAAMMAGMMGGATGGSGAAAAPAAAAAAPAERSDVIELDDDDDDDEDLVGTDSPSGDAASAEDPPRPARGVGSNMLDKLLNDPEIAVLRRDPELTPVFDDVETNGAMAAMKYMGNPSVMGKMQGVLMKAMSGGLSGI